jgi:hypothetical protein
VWFRSYVTDDALSLVPVRFFRYSGYATSIRVGDPVTGVRHVIIRSSVTSDAQKASKVRLALETQRDAAEPD